MLPRAVTRVGLLATFDSPSNSRNEKTISVTNLEEFVEAVCSLLYEDIPASVVVILAWQTHHLHLVNERVRSDDVVALE